MIIKKCDKLFFILFFLLGVKILLAQYEVHNFSYEEGLPHDIVYGIEKDDDGYIWLGTDNGLVQFNGVSFKKYSHDQGLQSNFIIDIIADEKERIISSWGDGLHVLTSDTIYQLPYFSQHKKCGMMRSFDDYVVIVSTKNLLYNKESHEIKELFFSFDTKNKYQLSKRRSNNTQLYNGTLNKLDANYFLYSGNRNLNMLKQVKGLHYFDITSFCSYGKTLFEDEEIIDIGVYNDDFYYAQTQHNIYLFDINGQVKRITPDMDFSHIKKFFSTKHIDALLINRQEKSTAKEVLYIKFKNDQTYLNISEKLNAASPISDVFIDNNYDIWVSVYGNGVYYLKYVDYFNDARHLLKGDMIIDATIKNDSLFLLGLDKIFTKNDSFIAHGTEGVNIGFQKSNDGNTEILSYKNPYTTIQGFRITDKAIFIADQLRFEQLDKALKVTGENFSILKNLDDENFQVNDITVIKKYKDQLYMGTDKGIFKSPFSRDSFSLKSSNRLLEQHFITDFVKLKDTLWVGTKKNVQKIIDSNNEKRLQKKFSIDIVNDVFLDHLGHLWVAAQEGLFVIKDNIKYHIREATKYNSSYFKIIEFQNTIYACGNNGVFLMDNTSGFKTLSPPQLHIDQEASLFKIDLIDFSQIPIDKQYKINNSKWITLSSDTLDLSSYEYGTYHVSFRARNGLSNYALSKKFTYDKERPWYQESISVVLFSTIIIMSLSLISIRRFNYLKSQSLILKKALRDNQELQHSLNQVREKVAMDFHDELGNKVAGITALSEAMIQSKNDGSLASEQIAMINEESKLLYRGFKDFIWSISRKSDNLDELVVYLTDFGENLYEVHPVRFFVQNEIVLSRDIRLPNYWSRHLILIFKEAMTNALKHSEAEEVRLSFKLKNELLIISLCDNGKGLPTGFKERSFRGIDNIKKRAKMINCDIAFISNQGLCVTFNGKIT